MPTTIKITDGLGTDGNPYPNIAPESTVEISGKAVSYHPKPSEYDMYEWVELVKAYHLARTRVISNTECVVKHVPTEEPYPLKREVESWGVDVTWWQPNLSS